MNPRKLLPKRALALLAAGLVLWTAVFFLAGPSAVLIATVRGLNVFPLVLALSAAALAFRAAAWKLVLPKTVSLVAVLKATVAIGGTPVRLAVLKKKTGIADGAGSLVMDRAAASVSRIFSAVLGLLLGFLLVPGNGIVRATLAALAAAILIAAVALLRRPAFFSALVKILPAKLVSPALRGRMEEQDRFLNRFRSERGGAFYASLAIHGAVFGLFALEIFLIGRAIDAYFPGPLALGLAALISLLRFVFPLIPTALGALETAVALVLSLLFGAPFATLGVAILLVLRLRTLVWWILGFAVTGNPLKLLFGR